MNQNLKTIQDLLQQNNQLSEQDKEALIKAITDADKQWSITDFKLDRTEKVKRTTAILLEETIEELEQKRKAVEAQNQELEIETALEKVRAVAMGMRQPEDMLDVCRIISQQLDLLKVKEIRNVQTAIFNQQKGIYLNYEFFRLSDKTTITEVEYNLQPDVKAFVNQMLTDPEAFFTTAFEGAKLKDWLEYQEKANQFVDPHLYEANSLHYYFYSIGPGALGISTYAPLNDNQLAVFKRFRNVFELAYRRFRDIEKALAQAREAQIEAALEKVRSRSLAMHKPDELQEVVTVVVEKLMELGVVLDSGGVVLCTYFKDSKDVLQWMAAPDVSHSGSYLLPYFDHPILNDSWDFKESGMDFSSKSYSLEEKNSFFEYAFKYSDYKNFPDEFKNWLFDNKTPTLSFAWAKNSSILIPSYTGILPSESDKEILIRFAKVFEQAYIRFLDLQKAEAQARESRIQSALERVRARTMAMQHSDELAETAALLFKQINDLGIQTWTSGFNIWEENDTSFIGYNPTPTGEIAAPYHIPSTENSFFKNIYEGKKRGEEFLVFESAGESLAETYNYMKTLPVVKEVLKGIEDSGFQLPDFQINHCAFFSQGFLLFITLEAYPDAHDIFKRFAKVFEQTYTRFLDLQKAEAQAREAKIEAALERTRTQSMIMQHSKELDDTLRVFHEQVLLLGINSAFSFLWLPDEKNDRHIFWAAWGEDKNGSTVFKSKAINYPLDRNEPATAQCLVDWKSNEPVYSYHVPPAAVENYFAAWQELIDGVEQLKPEYFSGGLYYVEAFMKYGCFGVMVATDLTEDEKKILGRFAIEFERTYTRFLDLQKAEAQAKEAQIEAALEKVRSRSLAMHKSDELQDVVNTLFERLQELDIQADSANIAIFKEGTRDYDYWVASDFQKRVASFHMPYTELSFTRDLVAARESGTDFSAKAYSFEEKNEWFNYAFKDTDFKFLSDERKQFILDAPAVTVSIAFSKYTGLQVTRYSTKLLSEKEAEILKRFSKVFEQAYVRFLDLQKAEAQAKEAKIEAALERVRAAAMAMHKSDDLHRAVTIMFEEFQKLNLDVLRCGIGILNKDSRTGTVWTTSVSDNGLAVQISANESFDIHPLMMLIYESWQKQEDLAYVLQGQDLINYYRAMETSELKLPKSQLFVSKDELQPQYYYAAMFNAGGLYAFRDKPFAADDIKIMRRFASVINLTYNRFLDLQKAEAQAREAQIEASLERVRSKTMAMHSSQDVSTATSVMFNELVSLGVDNMRSGVAILKADSNMMDVWTATVTKDGHHMKGGGLVNIGRHPLWQQMYDDWKAKKENFFYHLKGEDLKAYYKALASSAHYSGPYISENHPEHYCYVTYFDDGLIFTFNTFQYSDEQKQILKRFASVFNLTYRRYLDLKKAEAQARESQIQLALERVRARTMAMQRSAELMETAAVLFDQLNQLGENIERTIIGVMNEEERVVDIWATRPDGSQMDKMQKFPIDEPILMQKVYAAWLQQKKSIVIDLRGEELESYFQVLKGRGSRLKRESFGERRVENFAFFSQGILGVISADPKTPANVELYERFAAVFEQTYTRFLDLQKAEAQARESQIQLALERVRARTMAMQHSDELKEAAALLFQQAKALGVPAYSCGYNIWEKDEKEFTSWMSTQDGSDFNGVPNIPLTEDANFIRYVESKQKDEPFFVLELRGERMQEHYEYLKTIPAFREWFDYAAKMGFALPETQIHHLANFSQGNLLFITLQPCPEFHDVFKRFAAVFQQTYTRFLDLQKAEAQAREAQVEAALERIRNRTLLMKESNELSEATVILFQQFKALDLLPADARTYFNVIDENDHTAEVWMTQIDGSLRPGSFKMPLNTSRELKNLYEAWKRRDAIHIRDLSGDGLKEYLDVLKKIPSLSEDKTYQQLFLSAPERRVISEAIYLQGTIGIISDKPVSKDALNMLVRFAKVFEFTYTRFLDLKQAEAQAREAQIELGLERVRARAMAMQKSDELSELVAVLFEELTKLNLILYRCIIWIFNPETSAARIWMANSEDSKNAESYVVKRLNHPYYDAILKGWEEKNPKWVYDLHGKNKKSIDKLLLSETELARLPEAVKTGIVSSEHTIVSGSFNNFGLIEASGPVQQTDEQLEILSRFGKVFDLTYTRFNDLKQAETQAREATIEAALEKVRGKAMAMHNSNDLSSTASIVFTELRKLGINPLRFGVGLLNKQSRKAQLYSATPSTDGDTLALAGWVMLSGHPVLENIYGAWLKNEDYFPELIGEQLKSYYELILSGLSVPSVPDWQREQKQYGHFLPFSIGCLYAWSERPYNDVEIKILKRFATIIDLTFRRYMELQKSEANAKEAVKQAALDRVRADIASMRTTNDLEKIIPLIWNELTILGVPFIRCGVFIMEDASELIHTFLSTPDGKAIAAFHLPYSTPGNISQVLSNWQNKKIYTDHWDEATFTEFVETLVKQGALASPDQYLSTLPHGGFYLHFLPFLQGMLYVGSSASLSEDEMKLIQSVANAFSTAYARYEDFNKLEAAKQQVDKTLVELKQAQTQLVQSEKMASLGELTAGIAHEIQNPLNFVNNFSDVSNELLEEMKTELQKGNKEDAMAIADDVRLNLEKILHHGKRADAIVKGMLQHSRTSSGQKELTDINALADEYLRLAYHGLRAKDKAFNAKFETDFDNSVGKINIIPQDIGRVLVNLINNAFYAVTEKRRKDIDGYEPIVSIATKKIVDEPDTYRFELRVIDNGNGIPQKILDKIFQPFFTTKPTGQGTGLGLSLSYDIIKAHGGTLKVETKENEGSEFIIQIPFV